MILFIIYKNEQIYPQPITNFNNYVSIDYVCDELSLLKINPYLKTKNIISINNISLLKEKGQTIVYYNSKKKLQYYIINSKHSDYINLYREYKINKILL